MIYKLNEIVVVYYLALNKQTGLIDVTLKVYNPSDELVDTLTMVEIADGFYKKSFTPNIIGTWRIVITSVTNDDFASKNYIVTANVIEDVKSQLDTVEEKIDVIDGNIISIKSTIEDINGKVDISNGKLDTIESKIDDIDIQISLGGYIL